MALTRYDEVRGFFDRLADTWNEAVDPVKVRDMLSKARIGCGAKVLDVGTGTGILIPFLLGAVGPEGRIWALDISPAMLERAKAKGFSNVNYVCAAVEKMPFSDGSFDTVMCFNAFPHLIDKATAVSGSGPAYVFLFAESLAGAAVKIGFSVEMAQELVMQTLVGSAHLLQKSGKPPAELRRAVTSPGGTTAEAIGQFEKGGFAELVARAVNAAYEKAKILGK